MTVINDIFFEHILYKDFQRTGPHSIGKN